MSSSIFFDDETILMIMTKCRQPINSYSCLIVTIALSAVFIFEILTT